MKDTDDIQPGGPTPPPPVTKPHEPYAGKAAEKPAATKAKKAGDKKVKLTKSAAAKLKESLEKRQMGDKTPVADDAKAPKARSTTTKAEVLGKNGKPETEAAKAKRLKQAELPGTEVKMDKIGKAGVRFKKALEDLENAQDEKGAASENLLKAMKKAKRYRLQIAGYSFEVTHQGPKDSIKVTKPK